MSQQTSVLSHWQKLLAVLVIGAASAAAFLLVVMPKAGESIAQFYAGDTATLQAVTVDNGFRSVARQIEGLALLSELRSALNGDDSATLDMLEREWMTMFPEVDQLSLLPIGPLGVAGLDQKNKLKLKNNIEKDLVSDAYDSDEVAVDTYRIGQRHLVSFAKSVTFGGRPVGVILLSLKGEWLGVQLENMRNAKGLIAGGYTSVMYGLPGTETVVITSNRGADTTLPVSEAEATLQSNPNISIRYSVTELPQLTGMLIIAVLAIITQLAAVACAMIYMVHVALLKKVALDTEQLKRFIMDTFDAQQTSNPTYSVLQLSDLTMAFRQGMAAIRENSGSQAKSAGRSEAKDSWKNPNIASLDVSDGVAATAEVIEASSVPSHIFRAYDIRGIADSELTDETVALIGKAIGSAALADNSDSFVVARDGRLSSERIANALIEGLLSTGVNVIDLGLVATPVMYFAVETLDVQSGVMVTGSHNPPEHNGVKIVINGQALSDESITALRRRIVRMEFAEGEGELSHLDVVDAYMDYIAGDVVFASPMKVVLDCGNGAASAIAPMLYASLGCEVVPLFAEVDGSFPNHMPDPGKAENLKALIQEVVSQGADIGLAFDGDADRVVAVTAEGNIVDADQMLMLFAKDVLTRNPGSDVVYDVKSSRRLGSVIAQSGGRPVMWQSGHSRIKRKMREVDALLGGEFSGHFFFKERWFGFDDGMYAGARLIEHLTLEGVSLTEALGQLPSAVASPEIDIAVDEAQKFDIVTALQLADFGDGEKNSLDGLRVDYPWGWGLVRASNTAAKLTARFEADTPENLTKIKQRFSDALSIIDSSLTISDV